MKKKLIFMHPKCSKSQLVVDDCNANFEKRILWYRNGDTTIYLPFENLLYFSINDNKQKD